MGRFITVLLWIIVGFAIGYSYREVKAEIDSRRFERKHRTAYQTDPVMEDKPFVVMIMANEVSEKQLCTLAEQDYEQYRLFYVGRSREVVETFGKTHGIEVKMFEEEKGLALYQALHQCKSQEVVVLLGEGELLSHHGVLSDLNEYFANTDLWLATSQTIHLPDYVLEKREPSIHAFYAGIAQRIPLQEFIEGESEREFLAHLEALSDWHKFFIPKPLVLSPKEHPLNEETSSLGPLKENPWHDPLSDKEQVDLVLFSFNRPMQLYASLESIQNHVTGLHRLFVIYKSGNDHYEQGYQKVKEAFPEAIFLKQSMDHTSDDFSHLVKKIVLDPDYAASRFLVFGMDDNLIKDGIDLEQGAAALKKTGAYGLYYRLGNNLKNHPDERRISLGDGMFAWQFLFMEGEWCKPHRLAMTLFPKENIQASMACMEFQSPNILEELWEDHSDLSAIGLYYDRSKVVEMPMNIALESEWLEEKAGPLSKKELLTLFEQGLKMDLSSIEGVENHEIEISADPRFIIR